MNWNNGAGLSSLDIPWLCSWSSWTVTFECERGEFQQHRGVPQGLVIVTLVSFTRQGLLMHDIGFGLGSWALGCCYVFAVLSLPGCHLGQAVTSHDDSRSPVVAIGCVEVQRLQGLRGAHASGKPRHMKARPGVGQHPRGSRKVLRRGQAWCFGVSVNFKVPESIHLRCRMVIFLLENFFITGIFKRLNIQTIGVCKVIVHHHWVSAGWEHTAMEIKNDVEMTKNKGTGALLPPLCPRYISAPVGPLWLLISHIRQFFNQLEFFRNTFNLLVTTHGYTQNLRLLYMVVSDSMWWISTVNRWRLVLLPLKYRNWYTGHLSQGGSAVIRRGSGANVTVRMSAPMCRHVERCRHLCRHLHVLARADTSMCRHVLTYECYLEAGMCWHVSAPRRCWHLRRCRHL